MHFERSEHRVSVVVPAKHLSSAKSRLELPDVERMRIAQYLLRHTLDAVRGCQEVDLIAVVTPDPRLADIARRFDAHAVQEEWPWRLNRAVELGRSYVLHRRPDSPVAVVVADLPRLTSADINAVIEEFRSRSVPLVVPDQHGTGTTMLIHGALDSPPFRFGVGSALRHQRAGYNQPTCRPSGLSFDLDTPEQFAAMLGKAERGQWYQRVSWASVKSESDCVWLAGEAVEGNEGEDLGDSLGVGPAIRPIPLDE